MRTQWYKNAVVYQIYPFSFMDANNDGWGDIEGILTKLDYLKELGVTAIWFSPLYKSPDYDYGYDISDYRDIDEKFGTMEDFDRLLEECHKRDLKVIMDMVINHTSTEHPWFKAAIADPESKYRDYYIIRKGRPVKGRKDRNGKPKLLPPSNWASSFTGSAWERIGDTDDFYLHLFCKEQADLNWENPEVRREIYDILNFWLKKGVDGFRFDVFNMFSKVYPIQDDNSKKTFQRGEVFFTDGPRMHEFLKEMYAETLAHFDTFTVGESFHPSKENALAYVEESNHELDCIFNFAHLDSDNLKGLRFFWKPFNLRQFKTGFFTPQTDNYGHGWNALVLENHDVPRSVSRFGIDTEHYRYEAATMLATATFLGFGTPFIYMGEEAGLVSCKFNNIEEMKDPVSGFVYKLMRSYGFPKGLAFRFIRYGCRDHARVPMAWNKSVNGGFNEGHEPWQCVNPTYKEINITSDLLSRKSIVAFYRDLLKLKKTNETAIYGKTVEYDHKNRKILAYSREDKRKRLFIAANFSKRTVRYSIPPWATYGKVLINNYETLDQERRTVTFLPYQVLVWEARVDPFEK